MLSASVRDELISRVSSSIAAGEEGFSGFASYKGAPIFILGAKSDVPREG